MNHISDELINKYIDKEASGEELKIITGHLTVCDECLTKIKAARLAENALQSMNADELSVNFTEKVMSRINKAEVKSIKTEYSFIKIIFSLFILAIGATVGYGLSLAVAAGNETSPKPGFFEVLFNNVSEYFANLRFPLEFKIFQNSEIVGAIIVITLFTAGYYIYESHKELKKRAGQLR